MTEVVTLSSDTDDDLPVRIPNKRPKNSSPGPEKKTQVDGVPKSFSADPKTRFSFGIANFTGVAAESVSPEVDVFAAPGPRFAAAEKRPTTPGTTRKRSMSAVFLTDAAKRKSVASPEFDRFAGVISGGNGPNCSSSDDEQEEEKDGLNLRALISPKKKRIRRKDKTTTVQNEFFGVYCLISRSERTCYKNRCYIGYTVDPNRRIIQHNGGREKGGAKKTDSRGPWDMVCVVHGFPNSVAALRFEWAWQNPTASKVIKHLLLKKGRKETPFAFQLRIACHLMNSRPFCRFALTFRWLITSEELPFPPEALPPEHVKTRFGKVEKQLSAVPDDENGFGGIGECCICGKDIDKLWHVVRCVASEKCTSQFHTRCLAADGVRRNGELGRQLFPLKAACPVCGHSYLWGDVVREQRRIQAVAVKAKDEFRWMVVKKGFKPPDSTL